MTKSIHVLFFSKLLLGTGLLVVGMLVVLTTVFAVSKDDITYPVIELGSCENEIECRAYCDELDNISQCLSFAQEHNLLTAKDILEARKFEKVGSTAGPGGCRGKIQCQTYCENTVHIDECLAFAQQHDILDTVELDEARKVAQALRQGVKLPGGCTNKAQCELYCEDSTHINECLDFAEAAGFIGPEELQEARRIAPFMARGEMPGGCRSKAQCEVYCGQDGNSNECAEFFEKAGFLTSQEAEMFRKTGGKGPGGCSGREACEMYCNDPSHQEVCFEFAKQHDLIPQDEIGNLKQGIRKFREGFQNAPPEVWACLKDTIGEDVLSKNESGTFMPNPEMGNHMRRCFEEFLPHGIEGNRDGEGRNIPSEARGCIERVLGNSSGPPTPQQEQRIREECYSQEEHMDFQDDSHFLNRADNREGFDGTFPDLHGEFREELSGEFEGEIPAAFREQFEQRQNDEYKRQFEEEYRRQFDKQYEEEFSREFEDQSGGIEPLEGFDIPQQFDEHSAEPSVPDGTVEQYEERPNNDGTHIESRAPLEGFFGAVIDAMAPALKRFFPFLPL